MGDSIARQTKRRDDWLARHDLTLTELYPDKGVSGLDGRHAKTGKLSLFLAAIENGKVHRNDILIIEALDRLTRQKPAQGSTSRRGRPSIPAYRY